LSDWFRRASNNDHPIDTHRHPRQPFHRGRISLNNQQTNFLCLVRGQRNRYRERDPTYEMVCADVSMVNSFCWMARLTIPTLAATTPARLLTHMSPPHGGLDELSSSSMTVRFLVGNSRIRPAYDLGASTITNRNSYIAWLAAPFKRQNPLAPWADGQLAPASFRHAARL